MTEAVLVFTITPVQSFIAEARRASDLYVGSRILAQLARAAAELIGPEHLIYPAPMDEKLPYDVPNVIVARVPYDHAKDIAEGAIQALQRSWEDIVESAIRWLRDQKLPIDSEFERIWNRQIGEQWQIFWVAAALKSGGYSEAYRTARRALDATKRSRVFSQLEEPGAKDSVSGMREALHLQGQDPKSYWCDVSRRIPTSKLRPGGRERLDAVGAVKRFSKLADRPFPSTSTIASADFREQAKRKAPERLRHYRDMLEEVIGDYLYKVRDDDPNWPYDGDLLFLETLTSDRLKDSYGGIRYPERLGEAQKSLRCLYKEMDAFPSPYYAMIVLDGDGMGEHINKLLEQPDPEVEHRKFSRQLSEFSGEVPQILGKVFSQRLEGFGQGRGGQASREFLIYNGGDDVLAMVPLSVVLPVTQALAAAFQEKVPGCTASAGIAIVHHLYPLDAALRAAREAEQIAKGVPGKSAVAMQVLRRSGESAVMRSKWEGLTDLFDQLVHYFVEGQLSSRFAYDLSDRAPVVTALSSDARQAILLQLVYRHKADCLTNEEAKNLANRLATWAEKLDEQVPPGKADNAEVPQGLSELARWVLFARFVAQGGGK